MKIFAYRVEQNGPRALEVLAGNIAERGIGDRDFEGGNSQLRLEALARVGRFVAMDFAKARGGHGPGRMARTQPIRDFDLNADEEFGEDTGLVYDPRSRYAVVQYNHFGPRVGRIEQYLGAADLDFGVGGDDEEREFGYEFGVVLTRDAYRKLRRMEIFRQFEFSVSVPGVMHGDREAGRSLGSVLNATLPEGLDTIKVVMTAFPERNSSLDEGGVMGYVRDLQRIGVALKSAVVRGKTERGAKVEKIDLVSGRLMRDVPMRLGHGRRYGRQDRWEALAATLTEWLANGALPQA